jgi:hypothetical protein
MPRRRPRRLLHHPSRKISFNLLFFYLHGRSLAQCHLQKLNPPLTAGFCSTVTSRQVERDFQSCFDASHYSLIELAESSLEPSFVDCPNLFAHNNRIQF